MAKYFFVVYRTPVGKQSALVANEGSYWPAEMALDRQVYCYPVESDMANMSIGHLRLHFDKVYEKEKQGASQETNG